jgi:pimeloyl-ACP methyl ester carboxylesterase
MRVQLQLMDTRFDEAWLAGHPEDQAFVEATAARWGRPRSDEQRRGELEQLHARRDHDVVDRLGRITCPVLVAAGRFDGIAPPANGEVIATAVAHGELRVYEGGHLFLMQDDRALPEVMDFLSADDPGWALA